MEDLRKIIDDCAAGKPKAQEALYRMFAPKMFGVCLRYSASQQEAEDNLQDGFIKVFANIKGFRHEGSFEGWMRRIMVNVALEKYRKNKVVFGVEDMRLYDNADTSEDILSVLSEQELLRLIQELPPRYRMVFNLYVIEGWSHKEISEELEISEGTSKSNLARARDILKRKVNCLYARASKSLHRIS